MRSLGLTLSVSLLLAGCAVADQERASLGGPHVVSGVETVAYRNGPQDGVVTAESRYGSSKVSGPTRVTTGGRREVRLPGGTWIECGRSCSDTLRRETVDFWQGRDTNAGPADGPGYFRWGW
jgi:hypothetical protein